ncbi:uncharacterized protein A1O9_04244, partial [Exophiala aquamarina CBS 119918]
MDEPFPKRPRLSMFANHAPNAGLDADLDTMRHKNDCLLKSRFESIFEKYSKDFDGIGDEIDLVSGRVLVDNGHLKSMATETDPGIDEEDERGKAFLRAMTEAPDSEDSDFNEDADNVLSSIEEIAENTVLILSDNSMTSDDTEDELFRPLPSRTSLATPPDSRGNESVPNFDPVSLKSESDTDSLFDVPVTQRDSSPDSLFEAPSTTEKGHHLGYRAKDALLRAPTISSEDRKESAILARYGSRVGYEVIDLLQRERENAEAHIEPAWRIPSNIIPPKLPTPPIMHQPPPNLPSLQRPQSLEDQKPSDLPLSTPSDSVWRVPRTRNPRKKAEDTHRRRVLRLLRAESEDPLQDGFASDHADDGNGEPSSLETGEETERMQEKRDISQTSLGDETDDEVKALRQGRCFYCGQQYKARAGVVSHWTNLVSRFLERDEVDDVHDMPYILEYRQSTWRRQRNARLIVSDFRTMVELHEGAGLSFDEIADCGALRTRKAGAGLQQVYDRYRIAPEDERETKEWSSEELRTLNKLCKDPRRDVGTLSKLLRGRTETDIGGKMAEIWL